MERSTLDNMFKNLLHIGNKTNFWNPKMKNYIYGSVNGVHVIDLIKTAKKIEEVKADIKKLHSEGKKILFVATKLQSRDAYIDLAKETGHFYVSEKWVPGLLTNFKTIKRRIASYLKLLKESESGAFDVLTKKEKAAQMLELDKLNKAFCGLKQMKRVPDVIFVVDGIYEKQAIKEANSLNIISYAIMNTNGDDDSVVNIIPANTNSVKSTEYIAEIIKKELAGVKVSAPNRANFKKMTPNKISGDRKQFTSKPNTSTETKKVEVKKVEIKKVVEKKEEIKKVEK